MARLSGSFDQNREEHHVADSGGGQKGDPEKRRASRRKRSESEQQTDLIRALNHVLRRRILRLLHEAVDPSSPVRLAKDLSESLSNVSYHVRILESFGALKKVRERQVRGAIEHFYASQVGENPSVVALLKATKDSDEAK